MAKYRKKPVVVEAMQWDGTPQSLDAICRWANDGNADDDPWVDYVTFDDDPTPQDVLIHTLEGAMQVNAGDWIIRGIVGECYPCKPDIFAATYERVEDDTNGP